MRIAVLAFGMLVGCATTRGTPPPSPPVAVHTPPPAPEAAEPTPPVAAEVDDSPRLALTDEYSCRRDGTRAVCKGSIYGVEGDALESVHDVREIGAGNNHACTIDSQGGVRCWGNNSEGQLGDGTTISRWEPRPVPGLPPVRRLAVGHFLTCALAANGSVWCWGGMHTGRLRPEQTTFAPRTVRSLSSGFLETCAALDDGSVSCWGPGGTPAQVAGLTDVTAVSLGSHACALRRDKTVWCWGNNGNGQLGTDDGVERAEPKPVPRVERVVQVSAGGYHTCVRHDDGGVTCWGSSTDSTPREPTRIDGLERVVEIRSKYGGGVCALLADDTDTCVDR